MLTIPLNLKFTGDDADQHRLPAFSATESLDGVAKSLLIPINYLAEQRVRHKEFRFDGYRIDLLALRPGSLDVVLQVILDPQNLGILKEAGIAVTAAFMADYLKAIFNRAIGRDAPKDIEVHEREGRLNSGDMDAIVDAIGPSVKRAHTVIGQGAQNILLITGSNNVVHFNGASKRYVQTNNKNPEMRSKLVSVGSYNANSRYGRVFDYEFGKTVPFDLSKDADRKTVSTILESMTSYALSKEGDELKSAVAVKYSSIDSIDDKVKKMVILKARKELGDL